jgi:hypothetical protein|tara:strand:+ start:923 stop:1129 length:207 start_codon:yes stop_codon:yes gene_type:complete
MSDFEDKINPAYYIGSKIQVIDVIEEFKLGYHEANVLKYIIRYKSKNKLEDLKKAQWYLSRLIERYSN